jgi:RNA polymerase sigma-70 factor (ECF subfamily)
VRVSNAFARGLHLAEQTFVRGFTRALSKENRPASLDELALVRRCLARDPDALRALDRDYVQRTDGALAALGIGPADRDEVRQRLWVRLVLDQPPRLAQYTGRGGLFGFVRAVAVRLALDLRRSARGARADDLALLGVADGGDGPEAALVKRASRAEFRRAFEAALATLTARQRTLLRQAHVDGLSNEAIAHLHGTHRVTAFRWMIDARRALAKALRAELARTLRVPLAEVPPLAALVQSELTLSLPRVLA